MLVALALVAGFSVVGCKADAGSETAETPAEEGAEKFTVGYQIYYEGNAWSLQMAEEFKYGIETEYADMVDKVYYTSDEFDVTKQLNNFDDLVTKGCDIIFLCPLDPSSMVDKINEAAEMGIKVVVHAIDMDEADYISSVNVSDYSHGKVMAEWLVEAIDEKGEVALISGIAGTKTAVDITQATNDVFDMYPDV
jgi:ribose transport system substrate-binding protein